MRVFTEFNTETMKRYFVECDYDDATHFAHPVHENNTIDLSVPSVKIKPYTPPSEGEIYRRIPNPDYRSWEKCEHKNIKSYHDDSVICNDCNCVIEQFGEKIDNPVPLHGGDYGKFIFVPHAPPSEGEYAEIDSELQRAKVKHPNYPPDMFQQLAIMQEEAGEVTKAVLHYHYENGSLENVRKELIQTSAMCVRMLQNISLWEAKTRNDEYTRHFRS